MVSLAVGPVSVTLDKTNISNDNRFRVFFKSVTLFECRIVNPYRSSFSYVHCRLISILICTCSIEKKPNTYHHD